MTGSVTVLHPRYLVPIVPRDTVWEGRSVLIDASGRIAEILPTEEARRIAEAEHIELAQHVLMPGLVNCHGHGAMTLLRGYADDQPLMTWLQEHIWPAETEFVSEDFVADGIDLAIAEMILGGTTTFSDMYFFPDITAQHAEQAGIRAQLAVPIIDVPTAWADSIDDYIRKGLELRQTYTHSEHVEIVLGPHSNYTVSEASLKRVAMLANELDCPVQIHLHETRGEVLMSVESLGERPIDQLDRIGLLGPMTQCVHMTDLGQQDIDTIARCGSHVISCPRSNMKLASGICPTQKLLDAGINVALGTDGAASNNRLNMFAEMQALALLGKVGTLDPTAISAMTALEIATINGARALGYADTIGSVEIGKYADLIAVKLTRPALQPVHNLLSQLVYATSGDDVTDSWIQGRSVLRDGTLMTLDVEALFARAARWSETLTQFAQRRAHSSAPAQETKGPRS
jgi:5-methylthioadenosine/S-adenosylhomocysteine deaminase